MGRSATPKDGQTLVVIADRYRHWEVEYDGQRLRVLDPGPYAVERVERLLANIDWTLPVGNLAVAILIRWKDGHLRDLPESDRYLGDYHKLEPWVEVYRNGDRQRVRLDEKGRIEYYES